MRHFYNKHFHICCDGSFGNRYSCLIGGLTLARLSGLHIKVSWPSTNMCRALFYDLFSQSNSFEVENKMIKEYYNKGNDYKLLSCDAAYLEFFQNKNRIDPGVMTMESFLDEVHSSDKSIFYYTPLLYDWIPLEEVDKTINILQFNMNIINNVNEFIDNNDMKSGYYGIHLRMTDFVGIESFDVDYWIKTIENEKDKKFFVCSDDPDTEARFNRLSNAFSYPKKYKTEKFIPEGDWRHEYTDDDGRYSVFNVERGTEHVKEAVIDFLLLALSNPFDTGKQSTFLKMAKRIGKPLSMVL